MNKRHKTRDVALVGIMGAIMALISLLSIPGPLGLPITFQTFAAAFCGALLGFRKGAAAVGVYIALGCLGLPVFSQFGAGIGHLFSPTGGFIWGFFALAVGCGIGVGKKAKGVLWSAAGLALNYLIGVLQFALMMSNINGLWWVLPYLLKDVILVAFSISLAGRIRRSFPELIC